MDEAEDVPHMDIPGLPRGYGGNWGPLLRFLFLLIKEFTNGLKQKLEDNFIKV